MKEDEEIYRISTIYWDKICRTRGIVPGVMSLFRNNATRYTYNVPGMYNGVHTLCQVQQV